MVKKLMESIREYKRSSVLTSVFVTLEVVMEIMIPLIMAVMIDRGIEGKDSDILVKLGIEMCIRDSGNSKDRTEYGLKGQYYRCVRCRSRS